MHIIQKLDRNAYRNMCEYNRITGMCCYSELGSQLEGPGERLGLAPVGTPPTP